ncbi:MAG TPA: helix-turn-helix domain-containing protein [Pyrinomonadaceae bacterium]
MMTHVSSQTHGRVNAERPRSGNGTTSQNRPAAEYALVEGDITDLVQAESRIEALRSLVLIFLREVDSLKKVIGPRPRKKGDPIDLDKEMDAFEASLIRNALIKCKGNQRDASKLLNIKPTTLNAKMKRLGITVETTVTT